MATKSASRTKRPSPVVSKHGGSPSSSISSFSPSMDSTYPPLVGPAPTSPGLQSLYSESMLMDGGGSKESVTVAVRFRPLSPREIRQGEEVAWYADGDTIVRNEHNPSVAYAYDRVFGPTTTTRHVYDVAAQHVIASAMEGINGTVFAFGVTSSGKTHTMHGDQRSPGIIPLAVKDVFSIIQETPSREFLLRVSYLEIYNEVVNDLLNPAGQNLRIREDVQQGTFVECITEEVVLSPAHALSLIAAGEEHRHVGSNNFNLLSSRSHTIFTLTIESSPSGDSNENEAVTFSQLNLIDLAGSESSRVETTGLRRKEGSYINKSLLTLGTVIAKLTDGKASHIPYRDSKLTRLLQSSLSGHGLVSLICTVTPSSKSMEETHNTLKFAHRAKCIEIQASQNKIIDEQSLIKKYQNEIRSLKEELEQLKRGIVNVPSLKDPGQDIILLKQKLEDGHFKLQFSMEQEEEAKAALLGRIQRLTKLILVSTKAAHSSRFPQRPGPRRRHSFGEEELAYLPYKRRDIIIDEEMVDTYASPGERSDNVEEMDKEEKRNRKHSLLNWFKARKRESNLPASPDGDKSSETRSTVAPSTPQSEAVNGQAEHYTSHANAIGEISAGDHFLKAVHKSEVSNGNISLADPPMAATKFGDQIDLLMEQVKILSGEVALISSTLKRYSEDAIDNPMKENIEIEMKKLNDEILEKKKQMASLEKSIIASIQASQNNMDSLQLSKSFADLAVQFTEKSFELEVKSSNNRVMQELLQKKVRECEELHEIIASLKQKLSHALAANDANPKSVLVSSVETICRTDFSSDEFKRGIASKSFVQSQVIDELNQRILKLTEEKCQLESRNQKLAEESSYAKELASAAAVELKALSEEVTKLMRNNEKLTAEVASLKTPLPRRAGCGTTNSKKHGLVKQQNQGPYLAEIKRELASSRERELSYEAALVEKEQKEAQLQKMVEESKKRESYLENELANMWVLVAKLKKSRETHEENIVAQERENIELQDNKKSS
ncbi:unnamed protein product [Victoria cruziana]